MKRCRTNVEDTIFIKSQKKKEFIVFWFSLRNTLPKTTQGEREEEREGSVGSVEGPLTGEFEIVNMKL